MVSIGPGDLFESRDSLAHCVSECLAMGKGVATGFKELFGGVNDLKVPPLPPDPALGTLCSRGLLLA